MVFGLCGGCGWVEHKIISGSNISGCGLRVVVGGLAHCWVLRRHLLGVFSVPLPGLGVLTPPDQRCCWVLCVGVVVPVGLGVWWCVECCIVDASILLWSSY